jgi:hypothetical protein
MPILGALDRLQAPDSGNEFVGCSELAKRHGIKVDVLAKRLERWRLKHPQQVDKDWLEKDDPQSHQPRFLYRLGAIQDMVNPS